MQFLLLDRVGENAAPELLSLLVPLVPEKNTKKMKVEPDKKLLFIPFSSYRVVYHSENNQCGCYFKIPVDISLSDKDTRWCSFFVDDNKKN